jgi:tetratricopeptide (TPR) repeat protein
LTGYQELGDPGGTALALLKLGELACDQGDTEQAIAFSARSLSLFQELGSREISGFALHNLALAAAQQGKYARAEELLAEALDIMQSDEARAEVLRSIGLVGLDQCHYVRGEQALAASLRLGRTGNMAWLAPDNLEGIAGVAVGMGQMERAVHLFSAAAALRRRIGTPVTPAHRALYDRHLAIVRDALGPERWDTFWAEGHAMPLGQAIAYALEEHAAG